jgi:hypothetical protein
MPLDLSPMKKPRPGKTEGRQPKPVLVEYLYLDLQVCDRCVTTEQVLEEVLTKLSPVLQLAGYTLEYRKTKMETAELAQTYRFESSPTVRVNGRDICFNVQENPCDCCSDISGSIVDCRIFEYEGQNYEVPPQEMLAEAILRAVFGSRETHFSPENEYTLPKNLEGFYKGKNTKSGCDCVSTCC